FSRDNGSAFASRLPLPAKLAIAEILVSDSSARTPATAAGRLHLRHPKGKNRCPTSCDECSRRPRRSADASEGGNCVVEGGEALAQRVGIGLAPGGQRG